MRKISLGFMLGLVPGIAMAAENAVQPLPTWQDVAIQSSVNSASDHALDLTIIRSLQNEIVELKAKLNPPKTPPTNSPSP
jgi:hypothetical protein